MIRLPEDTGGAFDPPRVGTLAIDLMPRQSAQLSLPRLVTGKALECGNGRHMSACDLPEGKSGGVMRFDPWVKYAVDRNLVEQR